MGLKLKSSGGTGSVQLNCPDNHNLDTSFTLPATNVTGGEFVLADGSGNVNIDSGTLYVDAVNNRVGIGTSSPSTNTEINAALDTGAGVGLNEGQLSIGREADSGGAIRIGYDTTNNFGFISSGRVGTSWDNLILNAGGGNVGIGETAPNGRLHVSDSGNAILRIQTTDDGQAILNFNGSGQSTLGQILYNVPSNYMRFYVNGGEAARFDSSGRLLVGTTTTQGASHYYDDLVIKNDGASTGAGITILANASYGYAGIVFADSVDAVNGGAIKYWNNQDYMWLETAGTERLSISYNGKYVFNPAGAGMYIYNFTNNAGNSTVKYNYSSGLLSYDTSSRLVKENIVDCPYGIKEIKQLQPRKYVRLDGGETEIGFIADEMHEVMPEFAPCGKKSILTKNEEDEEMIPLSINYDKLTAVLTKALQEAIAKIETLETKVAALEGGTTP